MESVHVDFPLPWSPVRPSINDRGFVVIEFERDIMFLGVRQNIAHGMIDFVLRNWHSVGS